jgi:glycosyltransferase involved in cell wall biosynthesis
VLHVVSRQQRRGAEIVALELADQMARQGVGGEVLAMGTVASGDAEPRLRLLWRGGRIRGPSLLPIVRALRRELRAQRPDVVLAHGGQAALASLLAVGRLRIPVVWHRILELPNLGLLGGRRLLWPFVARHVSAAVAITRSHEDELRALGFRGPVLLEPNHRPWARFADLDRSRCRASLREELGLDASAPLVGFVGHLVDQKRPQIAVEVLRRCARRDLRLVVAGAGPLQDAVRAAAEDAGVADRVFLLGHRADVPELLAGLDALVVTSQSETMTGVVIEAQMAGCPVFSFALDGIDIVVADGETGRIVPIDDVDALAGALSELFDAPALRSSMTRAAPERGRIFSTETAAARYASFLAKVARGTVQPRPRVLYLLPNFGVGGAERALLMIARHAEQAGFQPYAASLGQPRRDESETVLGDLRALGVEVFDLGLRGRADRSPAALALGASRLRRLCRRLGIDIVDSCLLEADLVARAALIGTSVRHVAHLINTPYHDVVAENSRGRGLWRFRAARAMDSATGRLTDRFVALTGAVADAAIRDLGVAPAKIDVVARGVDLGEFPARPIDRADGEPLRVLSVGRLVPQKDHRTAIDAVRALHGEGVAVTYTVAGEGVLHDELSAEVARAGLEREVTLLPPTRDVAGLHRRHHVFCFPSLWEGQGNALLEAMASARPVVASDLPVLREVLGDAGVFFPPGDSAALAARLRELSSWPRERLEETGARLRARAEQHFAAPLQAERLGALYRALLGSPRVRRGTGGGDG